ncbi:MAG: potassium channel protein [Deltaproteobacteria bacterium]|nr:potassium channel protein [Deltaproteobacteria bacterium]
MTIMQGAMNNFRHVIASILIWLLIVIAGAMGYMVIEGWDLLDALYMTVITYSTVGYGEVHAISKAGEIYTMCLIFLGVGFYLYAAGAVIQFMVEGKIRLIMGRKKLDRDINRLKNHYVICGYGRIGRVLCETLKDAGIAFVAIENDERRLPVMDADKVLYICGNASDESVLAKAGITHAKGLVAALATDTDNVFLILTAKQLAPRIKIMARASGRSSKIKFEAAGADFIESPYEMGAVRMAQRIIRPSVTSFFDLTFSSKSKDIRMEEIPVSASSPLNNVTLKNSGIRQNYNLIILAIKASDDTMMFNPSFESLIKAGETVLAVGEPENLKRLEKELNPRA